MKQSREYKEKADVTSIQFPHHCPLCSLSQTWHREMQVESLILLQLLNCGEIVGGFPSMRKELFFFFFLLALRHAGSWFQDWLLNLCPMHRVLTIKLPGKPHGSLQNTMQLYASLLYENQWGWHFRLNQCCPSILYTYMGEDSDNWESSLPKFLTQLLLNSHHLTSSEC